jgi:N-acyl-D-aspartate/D-glutamate deacylase
MDYTIQHGTVVDGTGAARFAADVLIRDGRIHCQTLFNF